MTGFARRPLAVFVCCLFSGMPTVHALSSAAPAGLTTRLGVMDEPAVPPIPDAQPDLLALADDPGLALRAERRFNVLGKPRQVIAGPVVGIENPVNLNADDGYPVFVVADEIEGQADDTLVAVGNAELRKAGSQLYADQVIYHVPEDEMEASGSVRLLQEGAEVSGPHLRMRLAEQIGSMDSASYRFVGEVQNRFYEPRRLVVKTASGHNSTSGVPMMLNVPNSYGLPTSVTPMRVVEAGGDAERIDFEGENQFSMFDSTYSTCKPGERDWYLKTSQSHFNYEEKEGSAQNASLWFKGVPIFYTPAISFPLGGQPRSGFLHTYFAASTRAGLDLSVPYFWSIAPNYDLTLYPRYMSKRGFQLGAEARYVEHNFQGNIRAEYMPEDSETGQQRYSYRIEHLHDLGQGVTAHINWNGVSDDYYWQDMSSRLIRTSMAQLPRQVELSYAPSPWIQANLQVLQHQTLMLDSSIKRPYYLEPQLNVVGYKPDVGVFDVSFAAQYTRFTHPDAGKDQGDRFVFYPQVSLPIVNSAFQLTPKLGLHVTQYNLDRRDPLTVGQTDNLSRVLPTFTLDGSVSFEREGDWFGRGYVQTLEPRIYYVNIPYRDQSKIPLFDTGLADFNFAQIFSENRYAGYDRINDANQLTAGVTSRFIDGATGIEHFKAMVGQRYYFRPQRVAITGETARQENFSNLIAAVNGLVAPKTYADLAWEYNYRDRNSERFAIGVRYQPELAKVVSASYRYNRDALTERPTVDQIDLAAQWPLATRWYAVGRYNWSLRDNRLLEAIAGFEYNAGCWAVRLVGQRLAAIAGQPNDSIFLQLELNDFGSIGSNPIGLLRRSIPGYGKTNELPDVGNNLLNNP